MPKGAIEDTRSPTTLVELRDKIRELEIGLANVNGRGARMVDLLRLRDEVDEAMGRLGEGYDLRPEKTRVETIDNIVYRKSPAITRELHRAGGMRTLREEIKPPEEHWWWYLDLHLAEKRRKTAIRSITVVVGLLILLLAGNFAMDHFFGLNPTEKEARSYTMQAEEGLRTGNYDEAIAQYEKALQVLPTLSDAQLTLGVLYEIKARTEDSKNALATAEKLIGDRAKYLTALARTYNDVGKSDEGLAAINEALQVDLNSVEAYLIRATIYETTNKVDLAIQDLDRAGELAQAHGQDELYVLARMRLGMLLQRSPSTGGVSPGGGL